MGVKGEGVTGRVGGLGGVVYKGCMERDERVWKEAIKGIGW